MSGVRSEPTQARSRETVRSLLAAADEEFAEHGFEAAQITRIAERANVSVGSMYRFFPDKESLIDALGNAYLETITSRYGAHGFELQQVDDIPETLRRVIGAAAELRFLHPGFYRISNEVSAVEHPLINNAARTGLIEQFAELLEGLGIQPGRDSPALRETLGYIADFSRAVLGTLPPSPDAYSPILDELSVMLCAYFDCRTVTRSPSTTPFDDAHH